MTDTATPWHVPVTLTGPGRLAGRKVTVDARRWLTIEAAPEGAGLDALNENVARAASALLLGLTLGELRRLSLGDLVTTLAQIDVAVRADATRQLNEIKQQQL